MRNPNNVWEYFISGEKANSNHKRAYCKYCRNVRVQSLQAEEEEQMRDGLIGPSDRKTEEQLIKKCVILRADRFYHMSPNIHI